MTEEPLRRLAVAAALSLVAAQHLAAAPPDYQDFAREQREVYSPSAEDLLRIWIVYVGQGDGIAIQLPPKMAVEGKRPLLLVDAGAQDRMARFLERLYPPDTESGEPRIPLVGAVLTHHDQDHAGGFGPVLGLPGLAAGSLYHNGLATWIAPAPGATTCAEGTRAVTERRKAGDGFMGCFDAATGAARPRDLVENAEAFAVALREGRLAGVYLDLALAFATAGAATREFTRAFSGGSSSLFEDEHPADGEVVPDPVPAFELVWPPDPPRRFSGWSETINGNSPTLVGAAGEAQRRARGRQAGLPRRPRRPGQLRSRREGRQGPRHSSLIAISRLRPFTAVAKNSASSASWSQPAHSAACS